MRSTFFACVGLGLLLFAGNLTSSASVVTATHVLPSNADSWFYTGAGKSSQAPFVFDNRQVQTFTASTSGTLEHVAFFATKGPVTMVDLRVTVASLLGGLPDQPLASVLLSVDSFPDGEILIRPDTFNGVADFTAQNIHLDAQAQYAIVFSSDIVEANYLLSGDSSGYAGGTMISIQNGVPRSTNSGQDFFFEVTVTPVPEPSAILLATTGGFAFSVSSLRRRRTSAR